MMGIVVLHHGTGAQDFTIEGPSFPSDEAEEPFVNARRLLAARRQEGALDLLRSVPFEIYPATNFFNDEFHVLYADVPLMEYERFRDTRQSLKLPARQLAETIAEAGGPYIRFVAVGFERVKPTEWEVFICHASEDKNLVARPLVQQLEAAGVRCWYDEAEIGWGQSIVQKIHEGIARSRYVIVVVSKYLVKKPWAQKELRTALTLEIEAGETRVLPLLVGHPHSLLKEVPFLKEKRYLVWKGDAEAVVLELGKLARRPQS
ncbi:MAG: toll/interleukin-1 receptor domain-containing protein [Desulfobacterales bacterium]|nr:toll/interleukin-1 receptor domain-containing protein [Desulfobacterales bacterium]